MVYPPWRRVVNVPLSACPPLTGDQTTIHCTHIRKFLLNGGLLSLRCPFPPTFHRGPTSHTSCPPRLKTPFPTHEDPTPAGILQSEVAGSPNLRGFDKRERHILSPPHPREKNPFHFMTPSPSLHGGKAILLPRRKRSPPRTAPKKYFSSEGIQGRVPYLLSFPHWEEAFKILHQTGNPPFPTRARRMRPLRGRRSLLSRTQRTPSARKKSPSFLEFSFREKETPKEKIPPLHLVK